MSNKIKNIIFDLGAVVIDIDLDITYNAFSDLLEISTNEVRNLLYKNDIWNKHETGELSDDMLRNFIKSQTHKSISDFQIDHAFNALLIDIPKARIDRIVELSKKYKIFVLSNTNGIHANCFNNLLYSKTGYANLTTIFDQVYYSHLIGLRKPNLEIYHHVLSNSKINANETLFLDDNLDNILAAKSIGIHAIQVVYPLTILDYLKEY